MERQGLRERLLTTIDENYLLDILKKMVSIDSTIGNEMELAEFVGGECEKMGLTTEYDMLSESRSNVYARKQFSPQGKTLTFNGHLDTVEIAEGWDTDPMSTVRDEGILYGLGVADMKAGIACQLAALKAMLQFEEELEGTIHFTAVVDEESHGAGARQMAQHETYGKTDGIIIAEPFFGDNTLDGVPLGMTGKVLYEINVQGKSAHAFRPELGTNAITDAAKIVEQVDRIYKKPDDTIQGFQPPRDNQFGEGSFCVLKIDGGYRKYNVSVPESCQIILNRLTLPYETRESVITDLESLIDNLTLSSDIEIVLKPPFYQGYTISEESHLYRSLYQSYHTILEREPVTVYGKMISDANIFMGEFGIPTINFGPKGYNLHGANESVEMETLLPVSQIMADLFLHFQNDES